MFAFIKKHRLLIAMLVASIGTFMFLFQQGRYEQHSFLQTVVQTATYPIQNGFHALTASVSKTVDSYFYLVHLRDENRFLKQQISSLQEELDRYLEESIQYHRLKVQLEFTKQNVDKKIFAEVIGESIDNFHQVLIINRGENDGLKRNFAVVLKEGVVGRIQSVSPFEANVQLIIDHRSRFPAIVQRTRSKGIVYGGDAGLQLRQIHIRSDIKEGDMVVTSGLSGLFPRGILVGKVTHIEHQEHELFKVAYLTPAVDFDKIEDVFVLIKNEEPQVP